MKLSKTILLATMLTMASLAHAVDIKIASLAPNQSAWMQDMRAAGKQIEQRTNGRVKLRFYGGGTQGTQVRSGFRLGGPVRHEEPLLGDR